MVENFEKKKKKKSDTTWKASATRVLFSMCVMSVSQPAYHINECSKYPTYTDLQCTTGCVKNFVTPYVKCHEVPT